MIRTLLTLLGESRGRLVAAHLALTVIGLILRAAGTVLLVPLVAALFSAEPSTAWKWLGLLVVATAGGWWIDTLAARRAYALGFALLDSGQRSLTERISRIRLAWFDAEHTATTRQAVAATGPDLVGIIIYLVTPVLGAILLPVLIGVALVPISVPLTLAALLGVPLLLGAYAASSAFGRRAEQEAADTNTELTERLVEFARTQQALRAARRVDAARSLAGTALDAQHRAGMKLLLLQIPGQLVFGLASQLVLIILAGTVVFLSLRGEIEVPQAIALIVVIVRYLESFTVLAELSPGMESIAGSLRRMGEVLRAPQVTAGNEVRSAAGAPRLELREVSFRYAVDSGTPAVLQDFNLVLESGSTTALVGPSGSGKSTILSLLAGLHEPDAGAILIDGVQAQTLDEESRREQTSMVFQHPYLFDGSIKENLRSGHPKADQQHLEQAAALARVDTLITQLPDGWDTRVGEAGGSLSGGERQRVSIARALLKPAGILLVDEATSALDTENESAVAAALSDDPLPRTRVIVAHRLSSIRAADRVIFLEGGKIIEDGSIEELLESGGRFADFWTHQHAAGAWKLGPVAE